MDRSEFKSQVERAVEEAEGDISRALLKVQGLVEADETTRALVLRDLIRREVVSASERLRTQTRHCPYCSELIAADAVKCRYCEEWLDSEAERAAHPIASRPTIWYFVLFTGWLLILLVVGLMYAFWA